MAYQNTSLHYTDPEGYDARSQKALERYNKRAWDKVLTQAAKKYISSNDTVCDFGCGTLAHVKFFQHAKQIYAIDSNEEMLLRGMQKYPYKNITPIISSALDTPLPSNTCSVIWSVGLTEYTHLPSLCSEMNRVSQPGALLLIQFPRTWHPLHILVRIVNAIRGRTSKQFRTLPEIKKEAKRHGWKLLETKTTFIRQNLWCVLQRSNLE